MDYYNIPVCSAALQYPVWKDICMLPARFRCNFVAHGVAELAKYSMSRRETIYGENIAATPNLKPPLGELLCFSLPVETCEYPRASPRRAAAGRLFLQKTSLPCLRTPYNKHNMVAVVIPG